MARKHVIPADGSWFIALDPGANSCEPVIAWMLDPSEGYAPQPITMEGEAFEVATHQHLPNGECMERAAREAYRAGEDDE